MLVVDDDPTVVATILRVLTHGGYQAHHAAHGQAALDFLHGLAHHELPAALVIDHHMPVMDGPSMLAELARHEHLRPIPQLLVSGAGPWATDVASHAMTLDKPFSAGTLLDALGRLLHHS